MSKRGAKATVSSAVITEAPVVLRPAIGRPALYVLLGFSAGLPFYMFSTVLALRLQAHEIGLVVIED